MWSEQNKESVFEQDMTNALADLSTIHDSEPPNTTQPHSIINIHNRSISPYPSS